MARFHKCSVPSPDLSKSHTSTFSGVRTRHRRDLRVDRFSTAFALLLIAAVLVTHHHHSVFVGIRHVHVVPPISFASAYTWGGHDSDCTGRTYDNSKIYCISRGGRLAASLHTAEALLPATAPLCTRVLKFYWVGGEWENSRSAYVWQDGSNVPVSQWWSGQPAVRSDDGGLSFNPLSVAFGGLSRGLATLGSLIYTPLCEYKMCAVDDCSADGTELVREGRYDDGGFCCTCRVGYLGDNCSNELCSVRGVAACHAFGTEKTFPGSLVTGRCCGCWPHYRGANCDERICHTDYDCRTLRML